MKIQDNINLSGPATSEAGKSAATQAVRHSGHGSASRAHGSSDQVSLSDFAGQLSRSLDASASQRASRVNDLAAAYQSGSYNPDPAAVSKSMVASMLGADLR
jgi:flagellar biosynthesis anti-sigma factor FlgM